MSANPLNSRKYRPSISEESLTIYEHPDPKACEKIWRHELLNEDHRKRTMAYCDEVLNNEDKVIKIEYKRDKYGRFFTTKQNIMISCTTVWNRVRSRLFEATETDIDIINAHPNILRHLITKCSSPYMDCPQLENYCENRLDIFKNCWIDEEAISDYNKANNDMLSKYDFLKRLSTMVLYGSKWNALKKTCPKWEKEFNLTEEDFTLCDELVEYFNELQQILITFPELEEYKEIVAFKKERCEREEKKYHDGMGLSLILQEEETKIILKAMNLARKSGFKITAYTYDGFQILKNDAVEDLITKLNQFYDEIDFMVKPFKEGLNLSHIADPTKFDIKTFDLKSDYDGKKKYFEEFHFKVLNPVSYYEIRQNYCKDVEFKEFKRRYVDLQYYYQDKKGERKEGDFITNWEKDSDKRVYDTAVFMPPPRGNTLPKNVYNKWTGFPIENEPLNVSVNITRLLYHFAVVANFNYETYKWLLDWAAHIIQRPSRKTEVCPILIGGHGTGKSTIAEQYFKNMIGEEKTFITSEPSKFTGQFADLEGKLVISLNEANGANLREVSGVIKDRITCSTFPREKKHMNIEDPKPCFVNMVYTTNQVYFSIEKGERRFMPMEIATDYKQNPAYFEPLYKDFNYHSKISQINLSWSDSFMIYLKEEWDDMFAEEGDEIERKANEFYSMFKTWWRIEGMKHDHLPNRKTFGARMIMMECLSQKRLNTGNIYTLRKSAIEEYLKTIEIITPVERNMAC